MRRYFANSVMYGLIRKDGKPVTLLRKTTTAFDPITGRQNIETQEQNIRRALVLDETMFRQLGENLGANYGGFFDRANRVVVIRKADLDYLPDTNDQVFVEEEYWRIKKITFLREVSALALSLERVNHD